MKKLIIAIQKSVNVHGLRVKRFQYDPALKVHVWESRKIALEDFNAVAKPVFLESANLNPFVMVVDDTDEAAPTPDAAAPVVNLTGEVERLKTELKAVTAERNALYSALNPSVDVPFTAAAPVKKN
ncbi:MAG: hypothetical protein ABW223_10075 [Rariglobus sp.]